MSPEPKASKPKPTAAKETKEKAKKPAEPKAAEVPSAPEPKKAEPRPPADPRLKVLKKFAGRFLPKGELRDRYKALMQRWNSGEDHGGVTYEELKALLDDWRKSREKPAKGAKA
ncbi:MAG: hypothetical protein IRY99_01705 [Isosphaeraceae bacterium]|nr:hypothetical protein [Isosphaeraceae bacterium]